MPNVEVGQVWEMHSPTKGGWIRVVVAKVDGDTLMFRYEGVMEFITISMDDLSNRPDEFRRLDDDDGQAAHP